MKSGAKIREPEATYEEAIPLSFPDGTGAPRRTNVFRGSKSVAALMRGDAAEQLKRLPDDTFNVAVTSPPYFWVRDYGFDGQIGHEKSVDAYVMELMKVFDQVKRVLHPEGVFYLNIGDTYYSGNGQPHGHDPKCSSRTFMRKKLRPVDQSGWDISKKSLIGIPWKVAFEMQSRGWTLRSCIIWNRCNSFVEPTARDRPHRQYEPVFLFSKSRFYSYSRAALEEEDVWNIPIDRSKRTAHNAPFPSELVRRCVETGSPPGGRVLDPFLGSGTTANVALELGRDVVGIDMSEEYIADVCSHLASRGYKRGTWKKFLSGIESDPSGWESWAGNKANFRKPKGGKRKKRS